MHHSPHQQEVQLQLTCSNATWQGTKLPGTAVVQSACLAGDTQRQTRASPAVSKADTRRPISEEHPPHISHGLPYRLPVHDSKPSVFFWPSDLNLDCAEIDRASTHHTSFTALDPCSLQYPVKWAGRLLGKGRKQTTAAATSHLLLHHQTDVPLCPRKPEGPSLLLWATATDHHLLS